MSSVIVSGARTPMGRLLGNLKDLSSTQLGAAAIRAALERSGVAPDQVDYVIMGQAPPAGAGQMPTRQAAAVAVRPDREHRLAYPLVGVRLPVHAAHPEDAPVEVDRLVEVADGQTDVVDAGQHAAIVTAHPVKPCRR